MFFFIATTTPKFDTDGQPLALHDALPIFYNMLPAEDTETERRTAATNASVRTVYIIGPDKKIKAMLIYPMSSGRNVAEILRLLDSIQLTAKHPVEIGRAHV